jgi:hypothetical protein
MGILVLKNNFMRRINKLIAFVIIPLTLLSCNHKNSNHRLIPTRELVDVLTEMYVADGLLSYPPVHLKFASKDSISNYIDIIKRHGYTKERMDYTLRYYFVKDPKKLENIYDQILTKLNEKQALLEKQIPPSAPVVNNNLWKGPESILVPENRTKDAFWFSIPIKDTGNYTVAFTAAVFSDDQSFNPKTSIFFWHTDSSKAGYRIDWPAINLPKDGQLHNYSMTKRNSDPAVTHIGGWFLWNDPNEGKREKHAKFVKISLRKGSVE